MKKSRIETVIDLLFQEFCQDLDFYLFFTEGKISGEGSPAPKEGPIVKLVSIEKHGEKRQEKRGDGILSQQDALKTYKVLKGEFTVFEDGKEKKYKEGDFFTKITENFFSFISPAPGHEGHDICQYCGADNGPNGEYRQGWDCYNCGSN